MRGFRLDFFYMTIVFFTTIGVYNLSYLRSSPHIMRKVIIGVTFVTSLFFAATNLYIITENLYKWMFCGVLTALYLIPYKPLKLRNVPYLKSILVAVIWSLVAIGDNQLSNAITRATFFFSMCMVYALIIPFDMRDAEIDSIKTIPNVLGFNMSILISTSLILIVSIITFILTQNQFLGVMNSLLFIPFLLVSKTRSKSQQFLVALELLVCIQALLFYWQLS
jgi:hypothetical protein